MQTFAQTLKPSQQTSSARTTLPSRTHFERSQEIDQILNLQRTIGNRAVQRLLGTTTQRQMMDARGGGEGELVDERSDSTPLVTDGGTATTRPTPINVRNGPSHAPIDSGDSVGMSIAICISSSSGTDADMAAIQDSEQVGLSYNHTGSMVGVSPLPSSQSGFMAGYPIPDDQHTWSKAAIIDRVDNNGGAGSFEKKQLDVYTDAAGGVTTAQAIPNSGYVIKRSFTASGTAISFTTEKRAAAVTVNGYSTSAGPSSTQSETVQVRA